MRTAQKNNVPVRAWQLGTGSDKEKELISEGKIILRPDGVYELFSTEAQGQRGQEAHPGDYFKVDSNNRPYPNARDFFEKNHTPLGADIYEQRNPILPAWMADDPACPEIDFLTDTGKLIIDPAHPDRYFQAELWGAPLSAAKDAVVVFYNIVRDERGKITDAEFNFVTMEEFKRTYHWVD
jgi:hypothetical protein